MLKVAHYIHAFSESSETFIYTLIKLLDSSGQVNNTILTQNRKLEQERPYQNVKLIYKEGIIAKFQRKLFEFSDFAWSLSKVKPDIVHSHFGPNGTYAYRHIQREGIDIPLVTSLHGTDLLSLPHQIPEYRKTLVEMSNNKKCYFTVPSEFLLKKFEEFGGNPSRTFLLNNTYEKNFDKIKTKYFGESSASLKVVNVGRLVPIKGHHFLLKGFAKFLDSSKLKSTLTIIGDGPLKNILCSLALQLGISEHIRFIPYLSHKDLADFLSDQDMYIQSSIVDHDNGQEESFGIAVLEAIMVGLPVIVTRTGGLPEVVSKETDYSYIIKPNSAEAIAQILSKVSCNKKAFSDNGEYATFIKDKFSQERFLTMLLNIYKQVIL